MKTILESDQILFKKINGSRGTFTLLVSATSNYYNIVKDFEFTWTKNNVLGIFEGSFESAQDFTGKIFKIITKHANNLNLNKKLCSS